MNYFDALDLDQEGPMPVLSKASFDASLKQLLGPLLRGEPVWKNRAHARGREARRNVRLVARRGRRGG